MLGEYTSTLTTSVAAGPDPSRWLISDYLSRDDGQKTYETHWVYIVGRGQNRIIYEIPQLGALATQVAITTHILSTPFYLSWPLPLFTFHGVTGLQTFIMEASWDVWYEDLIDLTTIAGAYTYDLPTRGTWLDSEARITGFYDPAIGTMPPQRAPWRYNGLSFQGGSPTLVLKRAYLSSGGTAQLEVIRPASSFVNNDESAVGPTNITDSIYADPNEIIAVTLLRAYRYLSTAAHISDQERQRYAAMVGPQEAWVRANVRHYLPRDERPQPAPAEAVA